MPFPISPDNISYEHIEIQITAMLPTHTWIDKKILSIARMRQRWCYENLAHVIIGSSFGCQSAENSSELIDLAWIPALEFEHHIPVKL